MKNTGFKTKLIARLMVLVILLTSVLSFAGCGKKTNVDLDKRFNIDDGQIKFLCMRSIPAVFPEYARRTHSWSAGYYDDRLYIVDGNETYTRPYISYGITVLSSELGDGRTFYEKYINKYISMHGSYEYALKLNVDFYAFQGDVGEIKYEIEKYNLKGKKISIYNDNELIGEATVITKLNLSDDFYRNLFDKTLFVITIDKYSEFQYGNVPVEDGIEYLDPNLENMNISFLSIRDIRNYEDVTNLLTYKTMFSGGYSSRFGYWRYSDAVNKGELEFYSKSLESNIKIKMEFYEYREKMGKLEYIFTEDKDKGSCVELYSNSYLVGKIFYSSDSEIPQEWFVDFLNENLTVMYIDK